MMIDDAPPVVLVADDSATVRLLVQVELEAAGCRVLTAEHGGRGPRDRPGAPVDVVLLDVEMPTMDGFATVTALQADPEAREIPVVFLTGRVGSDDAVRALDLGALDYLRKPFEPAELRARVGVAVRVKRLQDSLRVQAAEMDRLSRTDTLTGLHNRRHVEEGLLAHEHGSRRHGYPLSVLIVDIDHFKQVNDTQGHPAGDAVLRAVGQCLTATVRQEDLVGRWGGEEFVIVAPHTDEQAATVLGERLRTALRSTTIGVTVSVGGRPPSAPGPGCSSPPPTRTSTPPSAPGATGSGSARRPCDGRGAG
jgi:diguanylate cyclase (GGDEF)-like protein